MTNWFQVRLGEIIREEREQVGSIDGDGLPVLGVTNIEGVTQTGVEASDDKAKYLRLRPGRFVYNPYRINVGSIGLSSESQDGICSPAYVVFTPNERVDANFLRFFLKSARGNQLINFHGNRGTVRSALRFADLCQIEMPLPPLDEQHRIISRIEELAVRVNEARLLRQEAVLQSGAFLMSEAGKVFSELARRFPLKRFGTFNPHVTSGPRNWAKHYEENGSRFYRAQDIGPDGNMLQHSKVFISPPPGEQGRSAMLSVGDLMLVITGATVGRCTVFREGYEYGYVSQHVGICRLPLESVNPEFALWGLRSPNGQVQLLGQRYGQGKPGLNLSNLLITLSSVELTRNRPLKPLSPLRGR